MKVQAVLAAAVLSLVVAPTAWAQTVTVEFQMGKVNVVAQNAPLRSIMNEWARVGGTRIINPERLAGPPVTLQLNAVPERQALEVLLRDVGGYILGPRPDLVPGASAYDRLVVIASSGVAPPRPGMPGAAPSPRMPAFRPPVAAPPIQRVPLPPPDADDIEEEPEIEEEEETAPPGVSGGRPGAPANLPPGMQPPDAQQIAPGGRVTPFGTIMGASRPGVVSPVPQQPSQTPQGVIRQQPPDEP